MALRGGRGAPATAAWGLDGEAVSGPDLELPLGGWLNALSGSAVEDVAARSPSAAAGKASTSQKPRLVMRAVRAPCVR